MTKSLSIVSKILVALSLFAAVICGPLPLKAADHREAPKVDAIPEGDITDVFLFTDPNDASRVVMIMNVNPFAAPAENPSFSFSPDLLYQFKIDNTGDGNEELVVQVTAEGFESSGPRDPRCPVNATTTPPMLWPTSTGFLRPSDVHTNATSSA